MSEHPKFAEISVAINAGMKNLDKLSPTRGDQTLRQAF